MKNRRRPSGFSTLALTLAMTLSMVLASCAKNPPGTAKARVQPDDASAAVIRSLTTAANLAERGGDHEMSIQYFRRLHQLEPERIDFKIGISRNLRRNKNTKDARLFMELLVEGDDVGPLFMTELGKTQIADGLPAEAVISLEIAITGDDNLWQARSALGIAFDRLGQFDKAEAAYRGALGVSADNPLILNNLAMSLAISGRMEEAAAILEDLVRRPGATPRMRQNLAMLRALKGDDGAAERMARQDLGERDVLSNLKYYQALRGDSPDNLPDN